MYNVRKKRMLSIRLSITAHMHVSKCWKNKFDNPPPLHNNNNEYIYDYHIMILWLEQFCENSFLSKSENVTGTFNKELIHQ